MSSVDGSTSGTMSIKCFNAKLRGSSNPADRPRLVNGEQGGLTTKDQPLALETIQPGATQFRKIK